MSRRAGWAALAVVLVAAAALAVRLDVRSSDDAVVRPWAWDPAVQPVAEAVEELRGLEFRHPVLVDFLPEDEFVAEVSYSEDDLSEEEADDLAEYEGLLRAAGLVEGDLDLVDALNTTSESGIAAYYSAEDERIRVRGEELTPGTELTLAHELVHALQDQHFDLERIGEAAEEQSDGTSTALQAVVEGDATRVEWEYYERRLDSDAQDAALEEMEEGTAEFDEGVADVPAILPTLLAAPYPMGEALLETVVAEEGEAAIDELYTQPPASAEQLLDPWRLVGDRDEPAEVEPPELRDGEEELDRGDFGSLWWLFLLAERVPLEEALHAVDGWGGDAYVSYVTDDRTCLRIDYVGDSAADAAELAAALDRWGDAVPDQAVTVERAGDRLRLDACEPEGEDPQAGRGRSMAALDLVLTRTWSAVGLRGSGLEGDAARCVAGRLVQQVPVARINDGSLYEDPAGRRTLRRLTAACGAPGVF